MNILSVKLINYLHVFVQKTYLQFVFLLETLQCDLAHNLSKISWYRKDCSPESITRDPSFEILGEMYEGVLHNKSY